MNEADQEASPDMLREEDTLTSSGESSEGNNIEVRSEDADGKSDNIFEQKEESDDEGGTFHTVFWNPNHPPSDIISIFLPLDMEEP